jgi:hypothetical protein
LCSEVREKLDKVVKTTLSIASAGLRLPVFYAHPRNVDNW